MSDRKSNALITTRKRQDNLYIDVDLNLVQTLKSPGFSKLIDLVEKFFIILDSTTAKLSWLAAVVGLGMGLGIAFVVFGQPDLIHAEVRSKESAKIQPVKVLIPEINKTYIKNDFSLLDPSINIGESSPLVISDFSIQRKLASVSSLSIGDEIIVLGSNNGKYRYRVIETRVIESKNIFSALDRQEELLILQIPNNLPRTTLFLVYARPQQ